MPTMTFMRLLEQLAGRAPAHDPGTGGGGPTGMAPGEWYPRPGQGPPDFGFDLWRGPEGYIPVPHPSFSPSDDRPPAPYVPPAVPYPWAQRGGPLDLYSALGNATAMFPPPQAHVWGVPLLPDAFRQDWTERLREALGREPQYLPPHF